MLNSFVNSAGVLALPFLPEELCSEVDECVCEARAKGDEIGLRASFSPLKALADRKVIDELADFQGD